MLKNSKTTPILFNWPDAHLAELTAMARELELTVQKFVIMSMKRKTNYLQKK